MQFLHILNLHLIHWFQKCFLSVYVTFVTYLFFVEILQTAGSISHELAIAKANEEYDKFKVNPK